MGRGLRLIGFPNVSTFTDRHGKARYRLRRAGFNTVYLTGVPGSPEFAQAYADAIAGTGRREIGASRTQPGSINALAVSIYQSAEWHQLANTTQATYRGIIERIRQEYGALSVKGLKPEHVRKMRDRRKDTPAAANNLLKTLRWMMRFAVDRNMRSDNPTIDIRPLRQATEGFHTWTEDEISKFEARWSLGTRERLAFDLLLYTAQRSGDVRQMGRQHLRDGRIAVVQEKTGARLEIPLHAALQASLAVVPANQMMFVVTQFGKPYTAGGFGNWFSDACRQAGLPMCSAHGLRKSAATRLSDAGCSEAQIMAVTGHQTAKEVQRYTRMRDQKRLADAAMAKVSGTEAEQELATRRNRVAKTGSKPLNNKA